VLFLGFLKFLKKDKGKGPKLELGPFGDLDVPPAPPSLGEKGFEGIGKAESLPELPDIEDQEPIPNLEEPVPELDFPEEKPHPDIDFPPLSIPKPEKDIGIPKQPLKFPELPEIGHEQKPRPLFPAPKHLPQKPKIIVPKPELGHYERLEKAAVREQKDVLSHKEVQGPIYLRVDRYRRILDGSNTIRNDLKASSKSIAKLDEIDANRDKVFEKWHNVMMDLQKKLIFIDKTLFKR
jgi:hypothetical protein